MTLLPFDPTIWALLVPAASALLFALLRNWRLAAQLNVLASFLSFALVLCLLATPRKEPGRFLLVDDLNEVFLILNAFVGFTTSLFSAGYIQHEITAGKLTPRFLRFYHAMYQLLLFGMTLALFANNIGILWAAVEMATLTTVLMVGIYRTPEAIEASWKYMMLSSVAIALALFGTTLTYIAARQAVGEGAEAMRWSALFSHAGALDPSLLNLAFLFILLGYGTKVGLVPLHAWLPDAHAEGPTPISAVLSGLLLNVALYSVIRFKMLLAGNPHVLSAGPILIGLGLLSVLFASFMLYHRRDIKRLFGYSSIEHMGIITFAFGLGNPLANFAGLLHMALHSLTKSGIFFLVGHISQAKGTQKIAEIRGLTETHPFLGWGLLAGTVAIIGMPPFGIFLSEFLIVSSGFSVHPWIILLFLLGLLVAFSGLLLRVSGMAFGKPTGRQEPVRAIPWPFLIHILCVLAAGIFLPKAVVGWFRQIALLLR
ncbi:NADH-quinone oxidoreductase subunit M [Methylacidimicrobium cyclopophantes]|uniref:NADH-quinone oxidoreductase subunit M n=1 Tax=Methylacidimicrobium cyclopophantes TaxID=1041766 RepID=A0A5E6MDD3_9BACT|nr:hydrogenase 4 subunit F [Methylacidimicrobium cyclopophantes]VVM07461.1 NADH-quinone oxidoreductase subunit M [Methylacidimicrobium cyclopophantes]